MICHARGSTHRHSRCKAPDEGGVPRTLQQGTVHIYIDVVAIGAGIISGTETACQVLGEDLSGDLSGDVWPLDRDRVEGRVEYKGFVVKERGELVRRCSGSKPYDYHPEVAVCVNV